MLLHAHNVLLMMALERGRDVSSLKGSETAGISGKPAVQTGTTSNGGTTQVQAWVQGAIVKISATTPSAEVLAFSTIPSTNLVGPVVPLPLSVTTPTFPETPAVHAPYCKPITKIGPLKQEVMAGVQGPAATVVEVEDGDQIVNHSMATITKGSEEVANPQSAWVGYGNCGQGYSSEE
ncbi:unnamed protein product, partial [Sphagnum compactum]